MKLLLRLLDIYICTASKKTFQICNLLILQLIICSKLYNINGVSRNTVAKVTKLADKLQPKWPLDFDMTDSSLTTLCFQRTSQLGVSHSKTCPSS